MIPLRLPDGIDLDLFLSEYWQKKPLLMPQALAADIFALEPEELAGLACEEEIESRLVQKTDAGHWRLEHGPFDEQTFLDLPEHDWTVLVQDVDKYLPEVAAVRDRFAFIPDWRIDDIMISYATDQGGVGPHTDAYDVFLLQAQGERLWRLSGRDYSDDELIPGMDVKVLRHFDTDREWLMKPGDVLYLPPHHGHWGIAQGDCMTWSVGFRAASQQEIAADWLQVVAENASDVKHYADAINAPRNHPGQICEADLQQAAELIRQLPDSNSDTFGRWFGCYVTQPKHHLEIDAPETQTDAKQLAQLIREGPLYRHPYARLAYLAEANSPLFFFHQGNAMELPTELLPLVELVANNRVLPGEKLSSLLTSDSATSFIIGLLNQGILLGDEEDL